MPVERTGKFIRARLQSPSKYSAFRYGTFSEEKGIYAIYGKLKGGNKWELQALRFEVKKGWTKTKVNAWLKSHGYTAKSTTIEGD